MFLVVCGRARVHPTQDNSRVFHEPANNPLTQNNRAAFTNTQAMLDDIPPSTLLFLVATCEQQPHDIDPDLYEVIAVCVCVRISLSLSVSLECMEMISTY